MAVLTVLSKVAGLIRDVVVASVYGAGPLADAYNLAYIFTGNVLILFGGLGGPFHSATVTTLTPRKSNPKAGILMVQAMVVSGLILTLLATVVFFIAPFLVHLMAPNYCLHNPRIHNLFTEQTIFQLRIMSPLIAIACLIGVTYGILNVFNRLFWPSVSPMFASIAIIVALFCCPDKTSSWPLAVGTLIGAFWQLFAQLPSMFRCNLQYKLSLKPAEGLSDYLSILWPAVIGTSIGQLTLYVDSLFCFMIPDGQGAWTAISNANRLIQLPLGVLITAMLVPILPRFTEQATANKPEQLKSEFRRALSFLWFISMPITMILLVIPTPLVKTLYERGAWKSEATVLVVSALMLLAPSIVIYIGRDLITRIFYAYKDSKTPYYVGMSTIGVKALLDWYFVTQLQMAVAGICLATTLITLFNLTLLAILLRRKIGNLGLTSLISPIAVMLIAAIAAGFCTHFGYRLIEPYVNLQEHLKLVHLAALLAGVGSSGALGCLVYSGICMALKLQEPFMLLRRLKLIPAETDPYRKS